MNRRKISHFMTLVFVFGFVLFYVQGLLGRMYVRAEMQKFEAAITEIHDIADIAQLAIAETYKKEKVLSDDFTFLSKHFAESKSKQLSVLSRALDSKLQNLAVEVLNNLETTLTQANKTNVLDHDTIEDIYIDILTLSNRLSKQRSELDDFLLKLEVIGSFLILLFIMFFVIRFIKKVVHPLERLAEDTDKFSLDSSSQNTLIINHNFIEYEILGEAIQKMRNRIKVQNMEQKTEMKSNTMGGISENLTHLINNPLTIIEGSARILHKYADKKSDEYVKKETSEIIEQTKNIGNLTSSVKKIINSSQKNDVGHFSLDNIVTAINLLYLSQKFEFHIEYEFKLSDEPILGIEQVVTDVCLALFENAVQSFQGVSSESENNFIRLELTTDNTHNYISVIDNGRDVSEEKIRLSLEGDKDQLGQSLSNLSMKAKKAGYSLTYTPTPNKTFILSIPKS